MTDTPNSNTLTCSTCGATNPSGSRFCERCGTRLTIISREQSSPTPIEAPADTHHRPERPTSPPISGAGDQDKEPADFSDTAEKPAEHLADTPHDATVTAMRDAPTVNFDLPDLPKAPSDDIRNAPTQTFDLPFVAEKPAQEPSDPAEAPFTTAEPADPPAPDRPATEAPAADPATADTPAEDRSKQPIEYDTAVSGWDYQPWRPQTPAEQEQAPPPPPDPQATGTRPAVSIPTPDSASSTDDQRGIAQSDQRNQAANPPVPPPVYSNPAGTVTYPTGGNPPPAGYQGSYTAPPNAGTPVTSYPPAPTASGPYPTPASGRNNRTLWIVLGVAAGLLFICAIACVLIMLLGAANAAGSATFATAVATTTRP